MYFPVHRWLAVSDCLFVVEPQQSAVARKALDAFLAHKAAATEDRRRAIANGSTGTCWSAPYAIRCQLR